MTPIFLILGIVCFLLGIALVAGCQALMPPPPRKITGVPKGNLPAQPIGENP